MIPTSKTEPLKTIVFLSHDSRDRSRIYVLRDRLKGYGFDVWMDSDGISPGEKWEEQIQKALKASHVVLICLSHRALVNNRYLQREIELARTISSIIIPVRLEECSIPENLLDLHAFDVYQSSNWDKLIRVLSSINPESPPIPVLFDSAIRKLDRLCSEIDTSSRVDSVTDELHALRESIICNLRDRFYEREAREFSAIVPDRVYSTKQAVTKYMATASRAYLVRIFGEDTRSQVPNGIGNSGTKAGASAPTVPESHSVDIDRFIARAIGIMNDYCVFR